MDFEKLLIAIAQLTCRERVALSRWLDRAFEPSGAQRALCDIGGEPEPVLLGGRAHVSLLERGLHWIGVSEGALRGAGGIYALATVDTWLYVGHAKRFSARMSGHVSDLRRGLHSNRQLQRAWNDSGGKIWFVVLERLHGSWYRHGVQHPREVHWKIRLRPTCDHESFAKLLAAALLFDDD